MDTKEIAGNYRLSQWAQMVQERNDSGQSIKAYCQNIGIREHVFYYRLRKLREVAYGEMTRDQSEATRLTSPSFVEVKQATQSVFSIPMGDVENNICIETAGIRITAGGMYPIENIAKLLRVVTQQC